MKTTLITLLLPLLLIACGPKNYKRSERNAQLAPENLKGRIWFLEKIIAKKDSTQQYHQDRCPISFRFEDQGHVSIEFSDLKKTGTYKILSNQFQYLFLLNEKIVYTPDDPACISTATTVSLYLRGAFTFQVENDSLMLSNESYHIFLKGLSIKKP